MSLKRKFGGDVPQPRRTQQRKDDNSKKHTLDSDEEDDYHDETSNVLDENDIEGEEDTNVNIDDEQQMTAFNMQEEMEMGHFDKHGHFIWKNEREVRDNWLDNIDWQKVDKSKQNPAQLDSDDKGLGEDSDEDTDTFNEIDKYKLIVTYLKPKENINKAIKRLGGNEQKLSSVERLRRKKAGTLTSNEQVSELTELANDILTATGNMDIYQETYETITHKLQQHCNKLKNKSGVADAELDMYSDDFDVKEKGKLHIVGQEDEKDAHTDTEHVETQDNIDVDEKGPSASTEARWELKRSQASDANLEGPFTTEKMAEFSDNGDFASGGVWVRKCGNVAEGNQFYAANRIDFDLYL